MKSLIMGLMGLTMLLNNTAWGGCKVESDVYHPWQDVTFKQKLNKKTVQQYRLHELAADQDALASLYTADVKPVYDRKGNYKRCNIKNFKFAGETFPSEAWRWAGTIGLTSLAFTVDTLVLVAWIYAITDNNKSLEEEKIRGQAPSVRRPVRPPRVRRRSHRVVVYRTYTPIIDPYALTAMSIRSPKFNRKRKVEKGIPEDLCNTKDFLERYISYTSLICK